MVVESTVVCIDNGEYMRNGDFVPNRMQAEQDAANLLIQCKLRSNPENCVGLLTLAPKADLQVSLTSDNGRLMSKLHQVQINGFANFSTGIRVAQLVLKHRQNRNHKTRIVVFVGSPVSEPEDELVTLAKKLKKEKLQVDLIAFGEEESNADKLKIFVETLNGSDTGSHLIMVSAGSSLQEALLQSPILRGEDGAAPAVAIGSGGGFDFGIDPNEDPELAMALRVSLEEQRLRQEQEARRDTGAIGTPAGEETGVSASSAAAGGAEAPTAVSTSSAATAVGNLPNFEAMTEEEQMEYALQISMALENAPPTVAPPGEQQTAAATSSAQAQDTVVPMEIERVVGADTTNVSDVEGQADDQEILSDPAALEALSSQLPGVDAKSGEPDDKKGHRDVEKDQTNDDDKSKKDRTASKK